MICEAWSVVGVRFCDTEEMRPAVVLSTADFNRTGTTILAQIVSSRRPGAAGDVPLPAGSAGLQKDSMIRMKLFATENASIAKKLGDLPEETGQALGNQIFGSLRLG